MKKTKTSHWEVFKWGWSFPLVRTAYLLGFAVILASVALAMIFNPAVFMFFSGFFSGCLVCLYHLIEDQHQTLVEIRSLKNEPIKF